MTLRRLALPSALAVTLALAPAAVAKLPAPATTTIVPGVSVAGVKLGMKISVAKQKWGAGSVCGPGAALPGSTTCTWSGPNGGKLILLGVAGKVRAITVDGGSGGPAITKFATAKGIRIGSTRAALQAAYPGLSTAPLGPANPSIGSGRTITSFYVPANRVKSIQVGSPY